MIDLSKLTQTQQWGLCNCVRRANEPIEAENLAIEAQNEAIRARNASLAEGAQPEPEIPLKPEITVQGYADQRIHDLFDDYWKQARTDGLQEQVIPKLMSLDLQQEMQLRQDFEIPNLIPDKYLAQLPQ